MQLKDIEIGEVVKFSTEFRLVYGVVTIQSDNWICVLEHNKNGNSIWYPMKEREIEILYSGDIYDLIISNAKRLNIFVKETKRLITTAFGTVTIRK